MSSGLRGGDHHDLNKIQFFLCYPSNYKSVVKNAIIIEYVNSNAAFQEAFT